MSTYDPTAAYSNATLTNATIGNGTYTLTAIPDFRFLGTEAAKREDGWRLTALVACGHAAFFLTLALVGWFGW